MNIAIILAGGIGSRMGAVVPKQFIEVFDKPVLAYTIDVFQQHNEIDAIEIVCIKSHLEYVEDMISKYDLTKVKWVTEGGADFQHSVINGVHNLLGEIEDDDTVLIHFGASPFVSPDIISDAIQVCKQKGNAISTTPFLLLSGKKDSPEYSSTYIDRDSIVSMNSPHAFQYGFIRDMYEEAISTGVLDEVEPHTTTLMYKMKKPIYFSKGSQTNIKLTNKEDVDLFEGYVLMKKQRGLL